MTIGQLAARSGMSVKAIRGFEGRGLIYTAGRTASNYRLFDESALWCIAMIRTLRGLGLTIREVEEVAAAYLEKPDTEVGPKLAELLDAVNQRIEARVTALEEVRGRLTSFRREHREELAGKHSRGLGDPRRASSKRVTPA